MISQGQQLRAARGLLNWSRPKLAERVNISPQSVAYWERASAIPRETETLKAVRRIFENEGVKFIPGGVVFASALAA